MNYCFTQTLDWVSKIQDQLYPILQGECDAPKEVVKQLERIEEIVIPEVKKAQTEIELRVRTAEALTLKGNQVVCLE